MKPTEGLVLLVWFGVVLCLFTPTASGQTRRALLVGIDEYIRPTGDHQRPVSARTRARLSKVQGQPSRQSISSLDGAARDAREMADLLRRKFQFRQENVKLLLNDQATGDAILSQLEEFLIAPAARGDVSVFYFAGHGSRIRNKSTKNLSGLDSSILPADSLLGVPDIRSKELARIYLRAVERGVDLTVIQDSCFSGGGARGAIPGRKIRAQEPDHEVVVDETLDRNPEDEGVLVLSASQDYQPAQEVQAETGPHGAFTWALLTALETSGPNERAMRIFQRTRALLQSRVNDQEPVMSQSKRRLERGIFAQAADPASPGGTAAIGFINPDKTTVELNSGITLGLHPGCELKRIVPGPPSVRIRVTEVNGPSSSNATLLSGDRESLHVGDLFQIEKWTARPENILEVFAGDGVSQEDIKRLTTLATELGRASGVELIQDPSAVTADLTLLHDGQWKLVDMKTQGQLLSSSSVPELRDVLPLARKHGSRIAILFPPTVSLAQSVRSFLQSADSAIAAAPSLEAADYALIGTLQGASVKYAWVRPGETQSSTDSRNSSLPIWPLRTDWITLNAPDAGSVVSQQLRGLARIGGWLRLRTPLPNDEFPYRLALRDVELGALADSRVQGGHSYKLTLERSRDPLPTAMEPRWIYIFVIDSFGKTTLVFPRNGTVGNLFPNERDAAGTLLFPASILLTKEKADVEVDAPYGIDNYFMLTTSQPIDNPGDLFNVDGVRTRSGQSPSSALGRLILSVNHGSRGAVSGVPTAWSVDRVSYLSIAPDSPSARRSN